MKTTFIRLSTFLGFFSIINLSHAQLSEGGQPPSFGKNPLSANAIKFEIMPYFDVTLKQAEDAVNDKNKGPFRFGYNHYVNYNLANSGIWTILANGDRVWQIGLKSTGAISLNLAFDDFYLPEGTKLFVYSADKKNVLGAFTNKNNDLSNKFATDLIAGDALVIEYYEPAIVYGLGRLNLFRVTHGYRGVKDFMLKSFGDAGSCQVNINCPLGANWQNEKKGVVCLVVGGGEFCTGSLINDVPQDAKPYVLTANHCSSSDDFATWVFRFNWESSGCSDPGSSPPTTQSLNASTLRARDAGTDFCLVEITGGLIGGTVPAAYSLYFNGWSNINTPPSSEVAIHHPSGDIKKISESLNPGVSSSYNGADCWETGVWTTACTEPGSSGSPLFDQNHRIIGQLYGGPSFCGGSDMYDYYGKFSTSWIGGGDASTQLMVWLDPGNTGLTTIDGFDPNNTTPLFTNDASIQLINAPANGYTSCNTSIIPKVVLRNYGSATLNSCVINYKIDAGPIQTYAWTGTLNTSGSTTIQLSTINGLAVGSHSIISYTSNPNGNAEQNLINDTSSNLFSIIIASPILATPQTENLQAAFPSANWTIGNPDGNETWTKVSTAGGFGSSSASARMNNNASTDISGQSDFIYSPYLNLSNAIAPIKLTFDVAYARYSNNYSDSLIVLVSNDCGDSWIREYAKGDSDLATSPDFIGLFTPNANQWRTETVNLDNYAGADFLKLAFQNKSGWGQCLYIDNINITNGSTSVDDNNFNSYFDAFPNPNNGDFYLNFNFLQATEINIRVLNLIGKTVFEKNINKVSTLRYNIDLSLEANGIYFVEVFTKEEKSVKKINIMKQ